MKILWSALLHRATIIKTVIVNVIGSAYWPITRYITITADTPPTLWYLTSALCTQGTIEWYVTSAHPLRLGR